jgi:hypothetical protein
MKKILLLCLTTLMITSCSMNHVVIWKPEHFIALVLFGIAGCIFIIIFANAAIKDWKQERRRKKNL